MSNTHSHNNHSLVPSNALANSTVDLRHAQFNPIVSTTSSGHPNTHANKSETSLDVKPHMTSTTTDERTKTFYEPLSTPRNRRISMGFKRTRSLQTEISNVQSNCNIVPAGGDPILNKMQMYSDSRRPKTDGPHHTTRLQFLL